MSGLKDHPLYHRMRQLLPDEVAIWVAGATPVEATDKATRSYIFRRVAKHIMTGRAERTKYGFNSDTSGEIASAMEWAFQAGMKAAGVTRKR